MDLYVEETDDWWFPSKFSSTTGLTEQFFSSFWVVHETRYDSACRMARICTVAILPQYHILWCEA